MFKLLQSIWNELVGSPVNRNAAVSLSDQQDKERQTQIERESQALLAGEQEKFFLQKGYEDALFWHEKCISTCSEEARLRALEVEPALIDKMNDLRRMIEEAHQNAEGSEDFSNVMIGIRECGMELVRAEEMRWQTIGEQRRSDPSWQALLASRAPQRIIPSPQPSTPGDVLPRAIHRNRHMEDPGQREFRDITRD